MIKECKGACLFLEIVIGLILAVILFTGCMTIIGAAVTYTYRFTGRMLSPPATTVKVLEMAAAKSDETRLTSVSISETRMPSTSITEIRTSSNPITESQRPRRGTVAIEQIKDFDNTL